LHRVGLAEAHEDEAAEGDFADGSRVILEIEPIEDMVRRLLNWASFASAK